jgi:hypothetical protein
MMTSMEPTLGPNEELPVLYRTILGLVSELEQCNRRPEAERIRAQALSAYATSWDIRQRKRLELLADKLRRSIAAERRPAHTWTRRN